MLDFKSEKRSLRKGYPRDTRRSFCAAAIQSASCLLRVMTGNALIEEAFPLTPKCRHLRVNVRGRLTVNGAEKRGRIALLLAREFSSRPRGTITILAVAGACCEVEGVGPRTPSRLRPRLPRQLPRPCAGFPDFIETNCQLTWYLAGSRALKHCWIGRALPLPINLICKSTSKALTRERDPTGGLHRMQYE
jgi:hypothetical protein